MSEEEYREEQSEFSIRDLLFVVFRHRKLVMYLFTVSACLSVVVFLLVGLKKEYCSEAKLLFKVGRETVSMDPMALTGDMASRDGRTRGDQLRDGAEILKSYDLASMVVDEMGLDTLMPKENEQNEGSFKKIISALKKAKKSLKESVYSFGKKPLDPIAKKEAERAERRHSSIYGILDSLSTDVGQRSSILTVSYTADTPATAHDVLDTIIDIYLQKHIDMNFTDSSYRFLEQKTRELETSLKETEKAIKTFKTKSGIIGLDEESLITHAGEVQKQLMEAEAAIAVSKVRTKLLKQKLAQISVQQKEGGTIGSAADEVNRRLAELRLQEQELLSTFTEESIPVQEIRRQISEIESMLPEQDLSTADERKGTERLFVSREIMESLQADYIREADTISALQAKIKVLRDQLEKTQGKISSISEGVISLSQLQRNREINESSYQKYAESLEEARIDQALKMEKISNVSIAQPPTMPFKPVKSKKRLILPLGIIGSLVFGIIAAFFLESLDQTIKRPEDVKRRLQLPTFVSIPFKENCSLLPRIEGVSNLSKFPDTTTKVSKKKTAKYMPKEINKYFESLIHRILLPDINSTKLPQIISVTSCRSREGVSTVASNLAVNLARVGNNIKVLLVDMKLLYADNPELSTSLQPFPDLGNVLAVRRGTGSKSLPQQVDQMFMVKANKEYKQTTILELQEIWEKEYEFVIIDLPPLFEDSRTELIARISNKVLLVVEAERERWQVVQRAKEQLKETGINLAGVVLNKRKYYIPQYLYDRLI